MSLIVLDREDGSTYRLYQEGRTTLGQSPVEAIPSSCFDLGPAVRVVVLTGREAAARRSAALAPTCRGSSFYNIDRSLWDRRLTWTACFSPAFTRIWADLESSPTDAYRPARASGPDGEGDFFDTGVDHGHVTATRTRCPSREAPPRGTTAEWPGREPCSS